MLFLCVTLLVTFNLCICTSPFFRAWHCVGIVNSIDVTRPYVVNIGELPLVFWNNNNNFFSTINICRHMGSKLSNAAIVSGNLKCQYHGLLTKPEDAFGKTMIHEGKLFWSYDPIVKTPYSVPFYNNSEYEVSNLEITMPCSIPDGAYNTMDTRHPEYVHSGLFGFGSTNLPIDVKNFEYKSDPNSIGLSFKYSTTSLATIGQNLSDNFHMFRYPSFTWSRVTFEKNKHLIVAVHMLPLGIKQTKWFVTICHNYKRSFIEREIFRTMALTILNQDHTQMTSQVPENKLKASSLFQYVFEDENILLKMRDYYNSKYEYPDVEMASKIVNDFYAKNQINKK